MHNLDINFLKDRQEEQPLVSNTATQVGATGSESNLPMIIGGVIMLLFPLLAFGYSFQLAKQNETIKTKNAELDTKIANAKGAQQSIEQKRQLLNRAKDENKALVSVFTQIKPWSAIFQDISDRIPTGVQITSIQEQAPGGNSRNSGIKVEIKGYATSQGLVNDFLLTLQESKFLTANKTQIEDTKIVENPIQVESSEQEGINLEDLGIKKPELVNYNITTQLSNTPASQLIEELSRKGAVGLVRRIRTLEQKGIPVR